MCGCACAARPPANENARVAPVVPRMPAVSVLYSVCGVLYVCVLSLCTTTTAGAGVLMFR